MPSTAPVPSTATRLLGNCQLCEGDFKLTSDRRLVHHGYKRPGDGMIHGDCPGVGELPYELSCALIEVHKPGIESAATSARAYVARVRAGTVTRFTEISFCGERDEYVAGVTAMHVFTRHAEHVAFMVEHQAARLDATAKRYGDRIAAWTLQPVRTFEEELAKVKAAKDERKAVRDAERAERLAKKAATRAKQEALKAERAVILEGYRARFRQLASLPTSLQLNKDRQALLKEVGSSKNRWLYFRDLCIETELVRLGLAVDTGEITVGGRRHLRFTDLMRNEFPKGWVRFPR